MTRPTATTTTSQGEAMPQIIQTEPARTTRRGRVRGPDYLASITYPPTLSGQPALLILTADQDRALVFDTQDALDSTLALIQGLGYDQAKAVQR